MLTLRGASSGERHDGSDQDGGQHANRAVPRERDEVEFDQRVVRLGAETKLTLHNTQALHGVADVL